MTALIKLKFKTYNKRNTNPQNSSQNIHVILFLSKYLILQTFKFKITKFQKVNLSTKHSENRN